MQTLTLLLVFPSSLPKKKKKTEHFFYFSLRLGPAQGNQVVLIEPLHFSIFLIAAVVSGVPESRVEFELCLLLVHRKRLPHFPGIRNMSEVGVNPAFDCGRLYPGRIWAVSAALNTNSLLSGSTGRWSCSQIPLQQQHSQGPVLNHSLLYKDIISFPPTPRPPASVILTRSAYFKTQVLQPKTQPFL